MSKPAPDRGSFPPRPSLGVGDELAATYARLSGVLLTEQTMETALQLITSLARDTVTGSLGSGVTLMSDDGRPTTSAATDPLTDDLDRLQYELDEGPCLAAWASSTVVRVDDLRTEGRWPQWSRRAVELGVRSVLSAPMVAGGATWGAVKVYSTDVGAYDGRSEDLLHRFAGQAAIFVGNVSTAQATRRIGEGLKETLRSRDVIATARGMIMARKGLDYERAYRQLVWTALRVRIPLTELAERMVATAVRPEPSDER